MKSTLIIARHGNTFRPGETPTRVGARTDLPLVEEHRGRSLGRYLKDKGLVPDIVYSSPLLRTLGTAELALEELGVERAINVIDDFMEIDYGPDENKTEEQVMLRLGNGDTVAGKAVIDRWNNNAEVPAGWRVDPEGMIRVWKELAAREEPYHRTTLLITSNGVIRFAPHLTGNFEGFAREHDIKVATGGVCIFEKEEGEPLWECTGWNIKPYKIYEAPI